MAMNLKFIFAAIILALWAPVVIGQETVKHPNVAGAFYPGNASDLAAMVDGFLKKADPQEIEGEIFGLISPHAGYEFSGAVAAFGYKLIRNRAYKTVVIMGPSHAFGFRGVSVYPDGIFRTPLGDLEIDSQFTEKLLHSDPDIFFEPMAFEREHSVEVQLPFLQRTLKDFKIVPVVIGSGGFDLSRKLAGKLKEIIGGRKDVLVVASSDMYHGYDYEECERADAQTLSCLTVMDEAGFEQGLNSGTLQMCGGSAVAAVLILGKSLGHEKTILLAHTNSAIVTGRMIKGSWTVGYSSLVIDREKGADAMLLNKEQRVKMLDLARRSIETYLKTGKKLQVSESDPALVRQMGAFVTLREKGELRGCIGNMVGSRPLYLTIRDMAVEAATGDPRFTPLKAEALKNVDIEISVLSPMERVAGAEMIKLGIHGVMVRRGFNSGVFLPQVAQETGWNKEQFLSYLCGQKAGLPADAWKDKDTELYVFTAEVFSEKE